MADDIDRAQAREELDRDMALAALRERIDASLAPRDPSIDGLCIDCDEAIEPARIEAMRGAVSRCIECAKAYEQRVRRWA